MKSKKVVLCACAAGISHLVPLVEIAKQFIDRGISVTIPVINVGPAVDLVLEFCNSNIIPNISFHILPQVTLSNPHPVPTVNVFNMLKLHNDSLRSFLIEQSQTSSISAIILDMFCVDALDVASELGIPAYFFTVSGATSLAVYFQLSTYFATHSFGSSKTLLHFHGVPPLLATHLPHFPNETFDPKKDQYKILMNGYDRLSEGKGILVNSFDSLEPQAVMALKDGLCLLNRSTPAIYCIGPLIPSRENKEEQQHPCISWLDAQPKGSVVFLCFGSMGDFPIEQLKEIAIGLEHSRQRFLWVVRSPPNPDPAIISEPTAEPDLDILMPEGFLDRTRDRGLIVKQWAPQVDVLKHEAVGCFVSHCGWNSIMEAVNFGVPMICWPLFAEQKINKVFVVEEMKIGIELKGYDDGFVQADEIEAKVKWIIGSEAGAELRNRMMNMKESAIKAMKEGGSSFSSFVEFLECLN